MIFILLLKIFRHFSSICHFVIRSHLKNDLDNYCIEWDTGIQNQKDNFRFFKAHLIYFINKNYLVDDISTLVVLTFFFTICYLGDIWRGNVQLRRDCHPLAAGRARAVQNAWLTIFFFGKCFQRGSTE